MKTSDIARTLLSTPYLQPPRVFQEKLGKEGYTEALRRGWLLIDPDLDGAIQVSPRSNKRMEMREAAAKDVPSVTEAAHTPESGLPGRRFFGEATPGVVQLDIKKPAPTTPPPPGKTEPPKGERSAEIGDQVSVAEGGQTYTARVSAKNPDGTMRLSFAGQKPPRDVFKPNEIHVTGTVPQK